MDFADDVRFAVRTMRRSVLATATIVLCLGFSIGATGTVFSWMEGILLRPVPGVDNLHRLVSLKTIAKDGDQDGLSYAAFKDVRDDEARSPSGAFEALATFAIRRLNLRTDPAAEARVAEPVWGVLASANYFDVLRVRPALGRTFEPGEDAVPRGAPVVVISHALWRGRFAGDPAVIGKRVWITNKTLTIVGVAPPGFHGTIARLAMDVWIPITMQPELVGNPELLNLRGPRWTEVFARLAPGATLASAREAARAAGSRLSAQYEADRDYEMTARTLDVGPVERMASLSAVMFGISILVLLIVCSNVANLLLQRGAAREHELAVRVALGAQPSRIVRQLMTESLLLAVAAIALGGLVLTVAPHSLDGMLPASPLPIMTGGPVDATVIGVLVGVGAATVLLFGLLPAVRAARGAARGSLGAAARGSSRRGGRLRGTLVAAQFALSLAVLITAGLFIRRLDELKRVERGFREPEKVALATIDFELSGVGTPAPRQLLTRQVIERVAALPGVQAASAASFVPLGFLGYSAFEIEVPGYVPRSGESMRVLTNHIGAGYFDTMGVPIVRGRAIDASDDRGTRAVAVVNQAFVRRFWGDADGLDRQIQIQGYGVNPTIVGVAGDGKYEFLSPLDAPSPPFIYLPFAQWSTYAIVVHARASGDPLSLVPSMARAVTEVDSRLSIMSPATLDSYTSVPFLPVLAGSAVLTVLGGAALFLATVGLYAVTAYAVTQERREIGIRMALGATPGRVVSHYLRHAARYAGAGAIAGIIFAAAIASGLAAKLPGSVPRVPLQWGWPFAIATGALAAIAAVAALLPANRAARVNPTIALRDE